jgi:hypothetical protein
MQLFEWMLVPWDALPPQFNPRDFPITVGLGQRVREYFALPFMQPVRDPGSSRELLLRGRYAQAVPKLITEDSDLREHIARLASLEDVDDKVAKWLTMAREEYANQQRAQNSRVPTAQAEAGKRIENLWNPHTAGPIYALLFGASSGPRDEEVIYQLGLCMQEQAEQLQARVNLRSQSGSSPSSSDIERCKAKWVDAKGWWDRIATDFPRGYTGPSARQNRGRTEAMLGNWEGAAATWADVSGPMVRAEKLAALYRSREARQHVTAKQ